MSMRRPNGDGTAATQRKDGTWYRTVVIDGKRKYVYGKSEAEVNRKFRKLKEEKPETISKKLKRMTVEDYMMNWLTVYKKVELKPKSYDTLESTILHQIVPHFKGRQFFSLTHDDIQKFINVLDGEGRSYSIIRKAYLALNACCKFAMATDDLSKNPCLMTKLPKKAEMNVKSIQVLSKEQIKVYCEHATERYGNGKSVYRLGYGLVLILFTGLRLGEAAGLMWEDIDFQKQTLKVQHTLEYVKNRNRDENENEAFYKELLFSTSFSNEPYQVFQNEDIAAPYLLSNWFLCDSGKDNYAFFEQILHMTRQQFSSSNATGARIAAEKIPELMDLVEQKFGYVSNVLKDRRLPILIVDEICTSGNSLTMGNCIMGVDDKLSQPKDIVIASRMKDDTAPEFAFLHELGHTLHIRLTHQYRNWEPPKSFDAIQQDMFKRLAGRPKQLWAECFADCFAISALYGTEYANFDNYSFINNTDKMLIYAYIQMLMDNYGENPNGECSFDELLKIEKGRLDTQ